jgi:hypothetical protein
MSLRLIQQLSIPQIDYSKLIVYTSNAPWISNIVKVYPNVPYQILNPQNDIGCLARAIVIELNGTLLYVNDYRHSHDSDTEDTTSYGTSSTSETSLLVIDYGSVVSAKEIALKVSAWASGGGYFKVYTSQDGATWTLIYSSPSLPSSEAIYYIKAFDAVFRYLKFTAWSLTSGYYAYIRARKIFIIT